MSKLKKTQRFRNTVLGVVILVVTGFAFLRAPPAEAFFAAVVHDPINLGTLLDTLWADFKRDIGKKIAKILLREIVSQIEKQITAGNDGKPTFVTNWRNYSRTSQDTGSLTARKLLGEAVYGVADRAETAVICEHLRDSIAEGYQAQPVDEDFSKISRAFRIDSEQSFKLQTKCTLPEKIIVDGVEKDFDIQDFQDNFVGGWAVFEKLFEPQNNSFGLSAIVSEEIGKQRSREEQFSLNEALSGGGFLSTKNTNNLIKSPGRYLGDVLQSSANSAIDCILAVDSPIDFPECLALIAQQAARGGITNLRGITDDIGLLDDDTGPKPTESPFVGPPTPAETCVEFCDGEAVGQCDALANGEDVAIEADATCAVTPELPQCTNSFTPEKYDLCVNEKRLECEEFVDCASLPGA